MLIALPPKVFLDTQFVIDAERGSISQSDWSVVSSYLANTARYCIFPLTIGELEYALANSQDEHFEQHKRRLRILLSPGEPTEVFDFIKYFFAGQFGVRIQRPAHLEDDFLATIDLILEAPTKGSLLSGFKRRDDQNQTARVRIDRLAKEHNDGLSNYVQFMSFRKTSAGGKVSLEQWATFFTQFCDASGQSPDVNDVARRLSAAYEFEMSVNKLMKNPNFSVAKNRSDAIDGQQLFYLCDPDVVFVSKDSDFKNRTKRSTQTKQIKTFDELLNCASKGLPLV